MKELRRNLEAKISACLSLQTRLDVEPDHARRFAIRAECYREILDLMDAIEGDTLRLAIRTIEGLADQQAMADDWHLPALEQLKEAACEQ